MMRNIFYILAITLFWGCRDKREKGDFVTSFKACNTLYIELYRVFGSGALGGDLLSAYLTDSTNFRKYMGTFDDAEGTYSCECRGDSIIVNEVIKEKIKPVEFLSLKQLKEKGEFE